MVATSVFAGAALALVAGILGTLSGLDRDRAFYPTLLMAVASSYCLFAVLGERASVLPWEVAGFLLFVAGALAGFRTSMWIVAAGLAGHGLVDAGHGHLLDNPGVPYWWPGFCLAFDVTAAAFLAVRILHDRKPESCH